MGCCFPPEARITSHTPIKAIRPTTFRISDRPPYDRA
jgi:hypothetical protein